MRNNGSRQAFFSRKGLTICQPPDRTLLFSSATLARILPRFPKCIKDCPQARLPLGVQLGIEFLAAKWDAERQLSGVRRPVPCAEQVWLLAHRLPNNQCGSIHIK